MTALRLLWTHRHDPQNGWPFLAIITLWAVVLPFILCLGGK